MTGKHEIRYLTVKKFNDGVPGWRYNGHIKCTCKWDVWNYGDTHSQVLDRLLAMHEQHKAAIAIMTTRAAPGPPA